MTHPLIEWARRGMTPEAQGAFIRRLVAEARETGTTLTYRDDAAGGYVRQHPDGRRFLVELREGQPSLVIREVAPYVEDQLDVR